ncbi:hypothetical protein CERZMDRAFT_105418 [Cercospora zeae-maydis SCOH1-5]|uniref:Uncharacterized protein n=1 Tax=Cercospora zeae-maydis SCOH1-5 TaxID=717836 RepID=A0A6A6FLC8_9PEZI|nr:hypothetical protein CERZMDRAFT_105418 [Cercospora zeae-maydis SCOH1-5]
MWTPNFQQYPTLGAGTIDLYNLLPSSSSFGRLVPRMHFSDLTPEIRTRIYMFLPQAGFHFFGDRSLAETIIGDYAIASNPPIAATCLMWAIGSAETTFIAVIE